MIEIDGSHGEGGGQLVRMACALAALTGAPVRLRNVRARRDPPGLAPQHLAAVQAVAALCRARTAGLALRAQEFEFHPGPVQGGDYRFDVGTAGSIPLVLQAVLPVALAARQPVTMHVVGGTDVRAAPAFDYFRFVFLPWLVHLGLAIEARLLRRGYYPRGGGEVEVRVAPGRPAALVLDARGALQELGGVAHVANLPAHIVERMRQTATRMLAAHGAARIETQLLGHADAIGPGGAIVLWARHAHALLGASEVAQRGVPAERIATNAAQALAEELHSGATLDLHAADQLLVYLALAERPSHFHARAWSSHAQTTAWLIGHFLPVRFTATPEDGRVRIDVAPY